MVIASPLFSPWRNIYSALPFIAVLTLMVVILTIINDGRLIVLALAVYTLSWVNRQNVSRWCIATLILAMATLFSWGVLIAACVLIAILLSEAWLADLHLDRLARLVAVILCFKAMLFVIVPDFLPHLEVVRGHLELTLALAIAAACLRVIPLRGRSVPHADPLLIVLLTAVICTYALSVALLSTRIAYPSAILFTTIGICSLLIILILLMTPFAGHKAPLTSIQHVFSLRVPIDQWVTRISAIAAAEDTVNRFISSAANEFLQLPGVIGVSWHLDGHPPQQIGTAQRQQMDLHCPPILVKLYRKQRTSPLEWLNYYLLVRITAEYCLAKRREEQNRADNLSRAMYETGARLTHDIKNILHTLVAMTQSINDERLMQQLPILRNRLETTLHKLQKPTDSSVFKDARSWWQMAQARYQYQDISFSGGGEGRLPADLFDLALDNFINNALIKRQMMPHLSIQVNFSGDEQSSVLRVTDDGYAVNQELVNRLFSVPVESQTGFGVALYQVNLEARKNGYTVGLESNIEGAVTFFLCR